LLDQRGLLGGARNEVVASGLANLNQVAIRAWNVKNRAELLVAARLFVVARDTVTLKLSENEDCSNGDP
jgi:hypothetical protein